MKLFRIAAALENLGLERRLGWVIDNTHAAIESLRKVRHRAAGLFHRVERDMFGVEETEIELPSWI